MSIRFCLPYPGLAHRVRLSGMTVFTSPAIQVSLCLANQEARKKT